MLLVIIMEQKGRDKTSWLAAYVPEQGGSSSSHAAAPAGPQAATPTAAPAKDGAPSRWVCVRRVKADEGPTAAFEMSRCGSMVALGQTDGQLLVGVLRLGGGGRWAAWPACMATWPQ